MSVHFLCQKFDVLLDFLHAFRNLHEISLVKEDTWHAVTFPTLSRNLAFTVYVTGSAKKGHNHTSLNLQYKAFNTLGEIVVYY